MKSKMYSFQPQSGHGKRILFANVPADGHFNPLTGLAVYLQKLGYEVRWYSSRSYAEKINKLGIHHYPFLKALEVTGDTLSELLPGRDAIKSQVKKLNFDLLHFFILRGPEYFEDIQNIYQEFPFDILIADSAFTGSVFVKEVMNIPVISMGIIPLVETSRDLPPAMLGMTPSYHLFGRIKQHILRLVADKILFGAAMKTTKKLLKKYNISWEGSNLFDLIVKKSNLFLQSGSPSFEYHRSDIGENIRFIGPLLPHSGENKGTSWFDARLNQYDKVVLVTQGTVEKDMEKLLVPALEAFKDSDVLLVATTGGSGTEELRKRFPQRNLIIEDFIPFRDIMPYADVYISNGGYGGVLLGIDYGLPMLVAGVHEGKNEINARIGYFRLGINLKTERPSAAQVRKGVMKLLTDLTYKVNVSKISAEFGRYDPPALTAVAVEELIGRSRVSAFVAGKAEKVLQ